MASRRAHRRSRKHSRRGHKARRASRVRRASRRCMYGGAAVVDPAPAGASDPLGVGQPAPSQLNLAQGRQYGELHANQHGGAYTPLTGAPLGTSGWLDASLRPSAGVDVSDRANAAILGLSDQSGGGRRKRRASRKSRKASRKGRKASRRGRKASRRGRKQRGGAATALNPADYASPGQLLPSDLEAKALGTMNPEWKLAADPTSFAPKA